MAVPELQRIERLERAIGELTGQGKTRNDIEMLRSELLIVKSEAAINKLWLKAMIVALLDFLQVEGRDAELEHTSTDGDLYLDLKRILSQIEKSQEPEEPAA